MDARRFSATALIGLVFTGYSAPTGTLTFEHLRSRTLAPAGAKLRLRGPGMPVDAVWARHGTTLALAVRWQRERARILLVDAGRLRVRRVLRVGDRDVCALGFDGARLAALVARPWCYGKGRISYSVLLGGRAAPVRLRAIAYPVTLAFGDGRLYAARPGEVDAVDLRTGAVVVHRPKRTLAKGRDVVHARWLGHHLLGLNGMVVDVRSWRGRTLLPHAAGIAPGPHELVAYGANGASVFTRAGRLRMRILRGEEVGDVRIVGRTAYATVGAATDVVDLVSGRRLRVVPDALPVQLLAP